jgi:Short C-terminal domain
MPKMTPEAEARYALDCNVARSDLSMPAQLAYDELVRDGYGMSKEEEAPEAVFPALGVQVRGDTVEKHLPGYQTRPLGPLAGAQAQLTDGHQAWSPGRAMFLPIGMAGLATKTRATAFVIFPDGSYHERALDGNKAVGAAQSEAFKFNLLASPPAAQPPQPAQEDTAATLRKLASLHDEGLLTDEEYTAKRAEVIARL